MHCDAYLGDPSTDQSTPLFKFISFHRMPAIDQFAALEHINYPRCFATISEDTSSYKKGTRVQLTMASRFGDVGITTNLVDQYGYIDRVDISVLDNFSNKAEEE